MVNLASFWKPEAGGQTVLSDRPILLLVEKAKFEKKARSDSVTRQVNFLMGPKISGKCKECDILGDFQTLWITLFSDLISNQIQISVQIVQRSLEWPQMYCGSNGWC